MDTGNKAADEAQGTKKHGIGWAVKQMHGEMNVTRPGWNGKGMWLAIAYPPPRDGVDLPGVSSPQAMTLPYIYMRTAQGDFVPWLASQTDILATDWMIFE